MLVRAGIEEREPDFILLSPDCGLVVLEVKDWLIDQLLEVDGKSVLLSVNGREERRKQPLAQAREYVGSLLTLLNKHAPRMADGKPLLPCPVTGGAVLPHISREEFRAAGLGEVMEEGRIIFWDELHEESPLRRDASGRSFACWLAEHFPPLFPFQLSGSQIDWLRARIFPVVRLELPVRGGTHASAQNETIRALDRDQENLARGMGAGKQLIIGPSGSSKTLILAHQAWNLPRVDKKIRRVLVTCFNLSLVGYIRRLLGRKGASLGPDGVEVVPFYSVCERILGEPLTHAEESEYYNIIVQEAQERLQGEHPLKGHWDAILVDEHAVGGQGEAEVLARFLFNAPGVGNQLLYHVKVHQGLAAEEVHLQVLPGAGVGNQKVQGLLAHLKGHERPVSVVFALGGKAVGAVQVAGVGDVQTQGLHHPGGPGLQLSCHGGEGIRGEELARILQRSDVVIAFRKLLGVDFRILGGNLGQGLFPGGGFVEADEVIGGLVHHMDRAGADVQNDVIAV